MFQCAGHADYGDGVHLRIGPHAIQDKLNCSFLIFHARVVAIQN